MKTKTKLIYAAAIQFVVVMALAQAAQAQIFGGRATGIIASTTIGGSTTNYVSTDTGQLPATGGDMNATSPSFTITGLLGTGVQTASTSGALKSSQSFAVVNDFVFVLDGVTVRANRVTVRTGCICCPEADLGGCSGSTQINALTITDAAGAVTTVSVSGQANQVVSLPGGAGTITINETTTGAGGISINGLHIRATSGSNTYDVVAANAQSSLQCLSTAPTAGPAVVSGRVLNQSGQGVSSARVTLTDENGNALSTVTNSLGYFKFAEVPSGETYILTVTHKMYSFTPQAIGVNEDMSVNITAN